MIDYAKYRIALRRLFKQKQKVRAAYAKHVTSARKDDKNAKEISSLEYEAWYEEDMINEDISILVTTYLVSKATKHFISIPPRKDEGMWEQCNKISERFVLTNAGISALRSSIRAEAKERRDLLIPLIAALTGIIGIVTGLIAVIKK